MSPVFDALPGIEVPVHSISKSFAKMWADTAASGGAAPAADDVKATQLNLVLHLGFATTPEDAKAQFQTALSFAYRYPCRVVVLCPLANDERVVEMRAKVYGECFLGKSKGDTRCVEFVSLSYPISARQYLENQVSICLSTDLPLFYWAHRFSQSSRLADYQYLLRRSKRVIFDTALVPADALTHPWPRPEAVRDLAYARLLPVRQSIGQFLAGVAPAKLVEGLREVRLAYATPHVAEAGALLRWLKERLLLCGAADGTINLVAHELAPGAADSFILTFDYANAHLFRWRGDLAQGTASFDANFGAGPVQMPTTISVLSPAGALSEAMFF